MLQERWQLSGVATLIGATAGGFSYAAAGGKLTWGGAAKGGIRWVSGGLAGAGGLTSPGVIASALKWCILANAQVGVSQMQYQETVSQAKQTDMGNIVAVNRIRERCHLIENSLTENTNED